MEERDKKTELLVGLFLTVGLLLLGLLILQFSSIRELFKGTYNITLPLPDASGIKEGSPVMLGGSRIGKVTKTPELNPTFTGVTVLMDIYKEKRVPKDAKFALGTSGLLGDSFIEIKTSGKETSEYFPEGASIPEDNITKSSGFSGLQDTAKDVSKKVDVAIEDLRAAVNDLRTSLKRINEGALSEDAMKDLKETFKHLNSVVKRIDEKTFSEETTADIKSTVASLKSAAKTFEDTVKKLDPAFEKIDSVAAKADKVMDSADGAVKSVTKTSNTIGDTVSELRNGKGLLPSLMKDTKLRDEIQMLITNLRQHGILWYRDSAGKAEKKDAEEPPRSQRPQTGTKR